MENDLLNIQTDITRISSLIAEIHTDATNYLDEQLKLHGLSEITASHGFILFILSQNIDETTGDFIPMAMKNISRKIYKDKSTTTVLIRKLENLGYVTRNKKDEDSRFSYISLTNKGLTFSNNLKKISSELSEKFYAGFSEEEKKTVVSLLKKIQSNFE
jgi:DNA-binding MarR family transcriptional regulator